MAARRLIVRVLICLSMFAVLAFAWHRIQPPWWEKAEDVGQMIRNQRSGAGYEGTDEYVPVGGDPYEIKQDAPRVLFDPDGASHVLPQPVQIQSWNAESRLFTAEVNQPGQLVLRLFNYPAWRVELNGRQVATASQEVTGQMLIPVQAGENHVKITFTRTWDRTCGGVISVVTVFLLGGFVGFRRRRSTRLVNVPQLDIIG